MKKLSFQRLQKRFACSDVSVERGETRTPLPLELYLEKRDVTTTTEFSGAREMSSSREADVDVTAAI